MWVTVILSKSANLRGARWLANSLWVSRSWREVFLYCTEQIEAGRTNLETMEIGAATTRGRIQAFREILALADQPDELKVAEPPSYDLQGVEDA